ncbi:unnamed protein product, partial [Rotaria socialis]
IAIRTRAGTEPEPNSYLSNRARTELRFIEPSPNRTQIYRTEPEPNSDLSNRARTELRLIEPSPSRTQTYRTEPEPNSYSPNPNPNLNNEIELELELEPEPRTVRTELPNASSGSLHAYSKPDLVKLEFSVEFKFQVRHIWKKGVIWNYLWIQPRC